MISETGNHSVSRRSGFTLLEVLISIVIMLLILTLGAVSFGPIRAERELTAPIYELQKIAKQASRVSATTHSPYVLTILPKSIAARRVDRTGNAKPIRTVYFPADSNFTIKPFGTEKWITPDKEGYLWHFDPSGLCEPISVKLEKGTSYYTVTFDPLTGGIAEEFMRIDG